MDLFVDIGDIKFTPSRERLSVESRTLDNIKRYLAEAIKSLHEELYKQVQEQPSIWKARVMLNQIRHSILGKVRDAATIDYHGEPISDVISMSQLNAKEHLARLEVAKFKKSKYRRYTEGQIICDGTPIYFDDLPYGGFSRITNHLYGRDKAYVLTGQLPQEFLDTTGLGEVIINASTLPVPTRKARQSFSDGTRTYVKHSVLQEYKSRLPYWVDSETELRDGGVYVEVSYGKIVQGETKIKPEDFRLKYDLVEALRPDLVLYGVRSVHLPKLQRYKSRWISFDDYAKKVLQEDVTPILDKIKVISEYDEAYNSEYNVLLSFAKKTFKPESVFGKLVNMIRIAKEYSEDSRILKLINLNRHYGVFNLEQQKNTNEMSNMFKKMNELYPLIKHIDYYSKTNSKCLEAIYDYVQMIDNSVNCQAVA